MRRVLLMPAALLVPLMMLAACATRTLEISRGTQTGSPSAACLSLQRIDVNRGKPGGATTEDISAALDKDHPVERVRNLVGDTSSTLTQVDRSNASLKSLCGEPNGAPPR